jgi:hypothetical protein
MEFRGRQLEANEATALLNQYYAEFLASGKQKFGDP